MKAPKQIALLTLLLSSQVIAAAEVKSFLSWYDGWGTHTVWGLGKVSGSFKSATIKCGSEIIPIKVIYDTHETSGEPSYLESKQFAEDENSKLLLLFSSKNISCEYLPMGSS